MNTATTPTSLVSSSKDQQKRATKVPRIKLAPSKGRIPDAFYSQAPKSNRKMLFTKKQQPEGVQMTKVVDQTILPPVLASRRSSQQLLDSSFAAQNQLSTSFSSESINTSFHQYQQRNPAMIDYQNPSVTPARGYGNSMVAQRPELFQNYQHQQNHPQHYHAAAEKNYHAAAENNYQLNSMVSPKRRRSARKLVYYDSGKPPLRESRKHFKSSKNLHEMAAMDQHHSPETTQKSSPNNSESIGKSCFNASNTTSSWNWQPQVHQYKRKIKKVMQGLRVSDSLLDQSNAASGQSGTEDYQLSTCRTPKLRRKSLQSRGQQPTIINNTEQPSFDEETHQNESTTEYLLNNSCGMRASSTTTIQTTQVVVVEADIAPLVEEGKHGGESKILKKNGADILTPSLKRYTKKKNLLKAISRLVVQDNNSKGGSSVRQAGKKKPYLQHEEGTVSKGKSPTDPAESLFMQEKSKVTTVAVKRMQNFFKRRSSVGSCEDGEQSHAEGKKNQTALDFIQNPVHTVHHEPDMQAVAMISRLSAGSRAAYQDDERETPQFSTCTPSIVPPKNIRGSNSTFPKLEKIQKDISNGLSRQLSQPNIRDTPFFQRQSNNSTTSSQKKRRRLRLQKEAKRGYGENSITTSGDGPEMIHSDDSDSSMNRSYLDGAFNEMTPARTKASHVRNPRKRRIQEKQFSFKPTESPLQLADSFN